VGRAAKLERIIENAQSPGRSVSDLLGRRPVSPKNWIVGASVPSHLKKAMTMTDIIRFWAKVD
jgi:hypothetical protein